MMMTVIEEEDSGSFDSNQGSTNLKVGTRNPIFQSEDSSNGDTVEDQEKFTGESLTHQDSMKNWHEFRSEDSRRDSISKPSKSQQLEFPSLVKGLDLDLSHHKMMDLQQKSSLPRKDSGSLPRGSEGSKGMTRSEMMLERDSYDRLSDFEDPAGRSFHSLDESLTSNIGQGGAASSNFTKKPSIEANETLNKIIQSTGQEDPESMLFTVIERRPADGATNKHGFWQRIGLKENKDKDSQWYALALDEWNKTDAQIKHLKRENETQLYEINQLDTNVMVAVQETSELEESSFQIKKKIIDEKMQLEIKLEAKNSEIDETLRVQEELLQRLQDCKDSYTLRDVEEEEREERWTMRIEDLRSHLITIMNERIAAEKECNENQVFLAQMENERDQQAVLNEQIDISLDLLGESMKFFTQSDKHLNFTAEFCEVLQNLRDATFEAIEAEKEFKKDAQTDPRTIMPYSRQSEFLPGASTRPEKTRLLKFN
ncbi:unnamed protein product [Blepharisma stoltei]|uniref:Uncharacterized protein n=1 Tax=Blepharisma stoltei TaxID=1481888 RepID=A0AAU9JSY3_9CILI|nr:unnamed protein product [Blepharisma stoltei]